MKVSDDKEQVNVTDMWNKNVATTERLHSRNDTDVHNIYTSGMAITESVAVHFSWDKRENKILADSA